MNRVAAPLNSQELIAGLIPAERSSLVRLEEVHNLTLALTSKDRRGRQMRHESDWACRAVLKLFAEICLDLLVSPRRKAGVEGHFEKRVLKVLVAVTHDTSQLISCLNQVGGNRTLMVVLQIVTYPATGQISSGRQGDDSDGKSSDDFPRA
jgi:hypothetical protein